MGVESEFLYGLKEEEVKGDQKNRYERFWGAGGNPCLMCRGVICYGRKVDCIKALNAFRNFGLSELVFLL